jgi:hypothetical protein
MNERKRQTKKKEIHMITDNQRDKKSKLRYGKKKEGKKERKIRKRKKEKKREKRELKKERKRERKKERYTYDNR